MDQSIDENFNYQKHLIKRLKISPKPTEIGVEEGAALIMNKSDISQRAYNNIKHILGRENVILPPYKELRAYLNSLNIGSLKRDFCGCTNQCLSCCSMVTETLEFLMKTKFWYDKMIFATEEQQKQLHGKFKELYVHSDQKFDPAKKTIFLTGDNFRAASKQQTEQISYSVMNIKEFLHSPYGQFIDSLWRGSESRENVHIHTADHYREIKGLVSNGIDLINPDGEMEHFNVLAFMCADLGFTKEVFGKCSSTSLYGCFFCKKNIKDWDNINNTPAEKLTMVDIINLGKKAVSCLGEKPDRQSKAYTTFHQNNYGQYVSNLYPI